MVLIPVLKLRQKRHEDSWMVVSQLATVGAGARMCMYTGVYVYVHGSVFGNRVDAVDAVDADQFCKSYSSWY